MATIYSFVYENELEKEFKIQSDINYNRIEACAYDATCYQFVSRFNKHGLKRRIQQFSVSILNSKCEYPFVDNEQEVEFFGSTDKNKKGYDLMLNDDIGRPAPYEYARGSFFLDRENPYPDPFSIKLTFMDPSTGMMIPESKVKVRVLTDLNDNRRQIKKTYPKLECFDPLVWNEYVRNVSTDMSGELLIGDTNSKPDDKIYPNLDGTFKLQIMAEKDNRVPIRATLHLETGGSEEIRYTVLWPVNPDERSIVDGYYFPDIIPE